MDRLPPFISGFTGAGRRLGETAGQILQDRLELFSLELREAKIRFVQALILTCAGVVFSLLGLTLLVAAAVFALPPEARLYGLVAAAAASLVAGAAVFGVLRGRLARRPLAFGQSLAELKKDTSCISTRS